MADPRPYISVIIPTFNRAQYIADSIRSVLNQKNAPWPIEVIVVDDGSSDNTEAVIAEEFGDQVRYTKIAPSGGRPAVPRNVGIKMARGELIAFQDSDDLWVPDKLAQQIPLFEKNPDIALSFATAAVITETGEATDKLVVPLDRLPGGERFKTLLKDNVISTLTVVARKSALEEVGCFNEAPALGGVEDYELWLRLSIRFAGKLKAIKKVLAHYRRHSDNISSGSQQTAIMRLNAVYAALGDFELNVSEHQALEEQATAMQTNLGRLRHEPETPLISVVMSVYNGERFLRQAIDSILNQTYRGFEFIIIDDGSTDNTAAIVNSYQDPRIRFLRQANHGLVYSLNEGVAIARGRFIARMDHDDMSLPSRLEKELLLMLGNERLGVVGSFFTYIDEQETKPSLTLTSPTKSIDLKRALYIYNPFPHGGSMIRREAFEQAGGYSDKVGPTEDYNLWCRISDLGWEFAQIPEPLYLYRLSPNGISSQKKEQQAIHTRKTLAERWQQPFVHKGVRTIVRGGQYYKRLDSPFANEIFHQYIHHQYVIAVELFARRHFKTGVITSLGAWLLDRQMWRKLWRPAAAGFLRKLRLKK